MKRYTVKNSEMIITASTMLESAVVHKEKLIEKRAGWADPFFDDFRVRLDRATQKYLGKDSAQDLRRSTIAVYAIQGAAKSDLEIFKMQLVEDFKDNVPRRDELLRSLGFKSFNNSLRNGDQEGMIELLYQFKGSMTPAIQAEITNAGTDEGIINKIKAHADTLKLANVTQEQFKSNKKELTAEARKEFNDIFDKIMLISNVGKKVFKDEEHIKSQFVFSAVAKALNAPKKITVDIVLPPPPPPPKS